MLRILSGRTVLPEALEHSMLPPHRPRGRVLLPTPDAVERRCLMTSQRRKLLVWIAHPRACVRDTPRTSPEGP